VWKREWAFYLSFIIEKTNQLTSTSYGIWTFNIEGNKLEGTLLVRGELFRKIIVYKHY